MAYDRSGHGESGLVHESATIPAWVTVILSLALLFAALVEEWMTAHKAAVAWSVFEESLLRHQRWVEIAGRQSAASLPGPRLGAGQTRSRS
jgi:hypothetical protein